MYLYLGQQTVISSSDVIGIFDIDNTTTSKTTKAYLKKSQKDGNVISITTEIPKSFIVCENKGENKVYLSQISPTTLKKRARKITYK